MAASWTKCRGSVRSLCVLFSATAGVLCAQARELAPATRPSTDPPAATTRGSAPSVPSTLPAVDLSLTPSVKPAGGNDLTGLSLEDLMNVEVSSVSKKRQSIAQAPAAVFLISGDDIHRSSFSTIPDLLRLSPGVDVARVNSHSWAVGVRGLNSQFSNKLLVLQDGRSLYNSLFGGVYWDNVDYILDDLDRIEVIRGPGATLWGANAVNGVINITSKDSRDTQGWLLSGMGSNDDSSVSARYGGRLSDDTTYRVYAKGKYNDDLPLSQGEDAGDQWRSFRGGFRIDKRPSDQDVITVQGDVSSNHIDQPEVIPTFTPPFSETRVLDRNSDTANILARWSHQSSADSDFVFQCYVDYFKLDNSVTDFQSSTVDFDFHDRIQLGQHNEVIWGFGYRLVDSTINNTDLVSVSKPTRIDNLFSTFVQDTLTLAPEKLFLTVGSKFEHNDYSGFEIEPSGRLLWTPNKQNSVWAGVSRAVRTPTRSDQDTRLVVYRTQQPTGPGTSTPVEVAIHGGDTISESLIAYELGYRVEPVKNVSFDFAVFYNVYTDLSLATQGQPVAGNPIVIPYRAGNGTAGETWGAEIASTVRITDQWRLTGSYSLLQTYIDGPTNFDTPLIASSANDSAPEHQAQIRSYYDITRNLQLNGGIAYVSSVPGYRVPAYFAADINLIWVPTDGLELKVGARSLFDSHPEYGVAGGQGIATEVPMTFFAELSYRF